MTHRRLPEDIRAFARSLRGRQTDAETLLWLFLRNRNLGGFKFRRQHPAGRYILDFYCEDAGLAVQLDGGEHNQDAAVLNDGHRSEVLREAGIEVIRFWNNEVLTNTEAVLERIYQELTYRTNTAKLQPPSTNSPSPSGRGSG